MTLFKSLMLAAVAATPIVAATAVPASAQVAGVAVADPEAAIQNSNAWKTAISQIQTTHKAALDQANARAQAVQNELRPLVQQLQTASQTPAREPLKPAEHIAGRSMHVAAPGEAHGFLKRGQRRGLLVEFGEHPGERHLSVWPQG